MRFLRPYLHTLLVLGQHDAPRLVEMLMLLLAAFLLIAWSFTAQAPYLILCVTYLVGVSLSILVREAIVPSPQTYLIRLTVILSALLSLFCLYSAYHSFLLLI